MSRERAQALRAEWDVLFSLAMADMRDRFGRGPTQVVKWLLDPYAVTGVYLIFVVFILHRGGDAAGLSVACAVVPFQLIFTTAVISMRSVSERRSLVLNLGFRRVLLPVATTLTEIIGFAATLSLLALMMAAYGIAPTAAVLWMVPVLAVNMLFALAVSYPFTLFGIWFPHLLAFAMSALRVLYFLAPGVVALSTIEGDAADWVRLNPLTGIFEAYRDALLYGHSPAAWELLYPAGFAVVLLLVFVPMFRSEQQHLAKVA